MNRYEELNDYFLFFKEALPGYLKAYGKDARYNSDTFYHELASYGYSDSYLSQVNSSKNAEQRVDIRHLWQGWVEHFQDNPNMNCFFSEYQRGFLQFHNGPQGEGHVKLYLNVGVNDIDRAVKEIYGFVADHNMPCCSKVSGCTRADSIVVRLNSVEDATLFIDWANNNKFLVSCAKKVNPFLERAGIVGIGYDDRLSFNSTVSMYLEKYFTWCIDNNRVKDIGVDDFRNYLVTVYNEVFINHGSLSEFRSIPHVIDEENRLTSNLALFDFMDVTKTIIDSLDPKKDYKVILKNIQDFQNPFRKNGIRSHFCEAVRNPNISNPYSDPIGKKDESVTLDLDNDIKLFYKFCYESIDIVGVDNIHKYFINYFSGFKHPINVSSYQEFISRNFSQEDVDYITNGNMETYLNNVYNDLVVNKCNRYSHDEYQLMVDLCKYYTDRGYNSISIIGMLSNYMNGDTKYITRSGGLRGCMEALLTPDKLLLLCNGNLRNFIEYIVNNTVNIGYERNYILEGYVRLASQKYGAENVFKYLADYINGNNLAITRDCNYRLMFQEFLSPEAIIRITNSDLVGYVQTVLNSGFGTTQLSSGTYGI